jgi:hypothetical protein
MGDFSSKRSDSRPYSSDFLGFLTPTIMRFGEMPKLDLYSEVADDPDAIAQSVLEDHPELTLEK